MNLKKCTTAVGAILMAAFCVQAAWADPDGDIRYDTQRHTYYNTHRSAPGHASQARTSHPSATSGDKDFVEYDLHPGVTVGGYTAPSSLSTKYHLDSLNATTPTFASSYDLDYAPFGWGYGFGGYGYAFGGSYYGFGGYPGYGYGNRCFTGGFHNNGYVTPLFGSHVINIFQAPPAQNPLQQTLFNGAAGPGVNRLGLPAPHPSIGAPPVPSVFVGGMRRTR
jgi:hypothetical protein